jgi:hypothetical protein
MKPAPPRAASLVVLALAALALGPPALVRADALPDSSRVAPDSSTVLDFAPGTDEAPPFGEGQDLERGDRWLRAPFGDALLTDPDAWSERERDRDRDQHVGLALDYNRVDALKLGASYELQSPERMLPRLGARLEYAFGRDRVLYGAQLEQPLAPPGRLALGVTMVRRTDHSDLQQVDDLENSLALLLGRQDYRDYFEREGVGAYLSWRVPDFSTISFHVRNDQYRSLLLSNETRSWLHTDRRLRDNPAITEGTARSLTLRLERLAHRTRRMRAGLYHWVELERAGYGMGGDFHYTRALADLRSVVRLSPATTLSLRAVGGHSFSGSLPSQKEFTLGGVDGLRAHPFAAYRGDRLALSQAEIDVGLWRMRAHRIEGGLHALAFVDAGRAWRSDGPGFDLQRQHVQADGGFGLGTAEDNLRVYFAKNLQDPGSDFVISARLQRPF